MTYLIVAYLLVAVILSGYGFSLWRRLKAMRVETRRLDLTMREEHPPVERGGR